MYYLKRNHTIYLHCKAPETREQSTMSLTMSFKLLSALAAI